MVDFVEIGDVIEEFVSPEVVFCDASNIKGDGRVVRWCWVNFQCRDVLQFGLQ